jgi:putative hemolysin
MTESINPFRLNMTPRWLASGVERLLALAPLARHYEDRPISVNRAVDRGHEFLRYTMSALDFSLTPYQPQKLEQIPAQGPLLIVSNHPLGGLEGVAMSELLLKQRPDLKVLTNDMLAAIPELSDLFIGVDVLSGNAAQKNGRGVRQACQHLRRGGALLIYPAGMVSAVDLKTGRIQDRQWNLLVGWLARKYQAHCLPCFVEGRNSKLFYLMGLIHPRLRTALLPRELVNKRGRDFSLHLGDLISPSDYQHLADERAVTDYFRVAADLSAASEPLISQAKSNHSTFDITVSARLQTDLASLIEPLESYQLLRVGHFVVYCAPYDALGEVMTHIARAREITFRAVGEGTGLELDSDRFDPYYQHLFVWDEKNQALVGGYRLARANELVKAHGIDLLYSYSLYHFDAAYLERLGGCIEMGRSFVVPAYQRHPRALDALWQGIGRFVARDPSFHTLFGCVSISQEYSSLARAFISESMTTAFRAEQSYINEVKPRTPLNVKKRLWDAQILRSLNHIAIINKLVGQCEPGTSVPVLLRHYLALNGRFVCFSVNPAFNDSLDGLIIVDLRKSPAKYLRRYLGDAGSQHFITKWRADDEAA